MSLFEKIMISEIERKYTFVGSDIKRYNEFVERIVKHNDTLDEIHFIIQHTKFVKRNNNWVEVTTVNNDCYMNGANNVTCTDDYDVEFVSYKFCFDSFDQMSMRFKHADNEDEQYAYNMFRDFEFKNFGGSVIVYAHTK